MNTHHSPEKNYDLERLIFFSDGVFAIAITLLVIEVRPPENWDKTLPTLLAALLPKLMFYVISFAAVGSFWSGHRFMFRYVTAFKEGATWLNLLFLMLISLTPLANGILLKGDIEPLTVDIYIGLIAAISIVMGMLWFRLAILPGLTRPDLRLPFKLLVLTRMSLLPPLLCGAALFIGVHWGGWYSVAFLLVSLMLSERIQVSPYPKSASSS